ncbi:MAG: glycerol-3-phosphate acyltransferase [Chloroflexi bacterium]|nr:glycerol-3-phosphate acyltransferase [Chloroflexota bacterium]
MNVIALALACYLLGSLPVAWIITKFSTGRDLRALGSGNVGVMNIALSVHRWAGVIVFVAELLKGALAVILARAVSGEEIAIGLGALAAIIGTRAPIWLQFKGGRGNTAAIGAMLAYSWLTFILLFAAWLAARFGSRNNFFATRITLLLTPIIFGIVVQSWYAVLFGALFSLIFATAHTIATDDHLLIKQQFPNLWAFISAPPRK